MQISIHNCNNIENGLFEIKKESLNVKYGVNGTGKTTISKALEAFITNNTNHKNALKPFKYMDDNDSNHEPNLTGFEDYKTISIFNEDYISSFIFQKDDLIKNSFEIFVKTDDYDEQLKVIEDNLIEIKDTFNKNEDLNNLVLLFQTFIDGFGKAKTYSSTGPIAKGLGKGNKLENIPKGLEIYKGYLRNENNVKWIKWQQEGSSSYLDIVENQCPFCSGSVNEKKEMILQVSKEYDKTLIENINKMVENFDKLQPYFSKDTVEQIDKIKRNISGINEQHKSFLVEIKNQVETVLKLLTGLKTINFYSLKDSDNVLKYLSDYRIDLSNFNHLRGELMIERISLLNGCLDSVIEKASKLQGLVKRQKDSIRNTIEKNSNGINSFLKKAGMDYEVSIEGKGSDYHLLLRHTSGREITSEAGDRLSYGERNAFALALFKYDTLKRNPDLIILDDPVSSFDGNKRFALINLLFTGKERFYKKTVLLLTHEFQTMVDILYVMVRNFNSLLSGSFLYTKNGILTEKPIKKTDFHSAIEIADLLIESNTNTIVKLVKLRNKLEIIGRKNQAYNIISSLFHLREKPTDENNAQMSQEDIAIGIKEIKNVIPLFDYDALLSKLNDHTEMKELYYSCKTGYEKACIFRVMYGKNNDSKKKEKILWKQLNEIYHIENTFLYQLNPIEFDTIPQFIIEQCDNIINSEDECYQGE